MRHKIIATLLAISLVIGMVPITAFAEGENEQNTGVAIDEENFPDENFREYVSGYDDNQDGYFSDEEIESVSSLSMYYEDIESLKGVEYFSVLSYLYVENCNLLGTLDLSSLKNLTYLDCSRNMLTDIKLCGDASYEYIDVSYNELSEENTIEFWPSEGAEVYYSPQEKNRVHINEENFPDPAFRNCLLNEYGRYIKAETIENETWLDLSDIGIKDLKGIEYFKNLETLWCDNNDLSGVLDLSMLSKLDYISLECNRLTGLKLNVSYGANVYVRYNQMSSKADLIGGLNPYNEDMYIEFYPQGEKTQGVAINNINFPDDNFRAFVKKYDSGRDNILTAKELESITEIYEFDIDGGIKDFKGIEYLTSLRSVYLNDPVVQNLTLPDSVGQFHCEGCGLSELPELPADLQYLTCYNNALATITTLPSHLRWIDCSNNQLTSLPALPETLKGLNCEHNELTTLPTLPTYLESLSCGYNKLTSLPALPIYLQSVDVYHNQLTGILDVSNLNHVGFFDCSDNNLTGVKLSPTASYYQVNVTDNYMSSTSAVTGRNGITWEKSGYWFSPQKNNCQVTGKHNYNSYKIITYATCTTDGSKVYTCSGCGTTKLETIKATGHNYKVTKVNKKATTKKSGQITKKCTVCAKVVKETTYRAKSIGLSKTKFTYNGKTQKPTVTVKDSKGKVISSSNYKVSYSKGCKNAGTYKVTVTFKGQYSGKLTKSFKISKAKPKITASNFEKVKGDKAFSIKPTITPKGGKVTYKTNNKKVATVSSKGKVTIKGKGKATITITSASNKNCSKVTKKITVTVK